MSKNYWHICVHTVGFENLESLTLLFRYRYIPAKVPKQFTSKDIIQFQPGTVAFDSKIKGFYIPVVIR
ncbi:hypothetical protein [Flavilitoribacter nigricans]|uniref:hypothetical protein n=1 Tax=Flavilitoribacter nigricans TaxID=70997 RepID=UPI00117B47FC|nr:hypothetical protein [Flavilitoribacter nigricans]